MITTEWAIVILFALWIGGWSTAYPWYLFRRGRRRIGR